MTSETQRPGDLKAWHWLATVVFPLYGSRQGQGLPSPPVVVTRVSLSSQNDVILKAEVVDADCRLDIWKVDIRSVGSVEEYENVIWIKDQRQTILVTMNRIELGAL